MTPEAVFLVDGTRIPIRGDLGVIRAVNIGTGKEEVGVGISAVGEEYTVPQKLDHLLR